MLGSDPWEKQQEINDAIARAVKERKDVAIRSCHSSGKTWDLARIVLWFLSNFPHSNVITTAPTFRQVEQLLWRDIRIAHRNAIIPVGGTMLMTRWEIDLDWFAIGLSTDIPENFQGFHAPYILVVVDEASGVPENIFEAIDGITSGGIAVVIMIGNPTKISGSFAKAMKSPDVIKLHISGFDTPNVKAGYTIVPGLMAPDYPEKMARKYGKDSDVYRIKVLGEMPRAESDTLISVDDVEQAQRRKLPDYSKLWICSNDAQEYDGDSACPKCGKTDRRLKFPKKMGVDVARFGNDDSVIVIRQGGKVLRRESRHGQDTMEIAGWAKRVSKEESITAENMFVDVIGIGAGVVDRLKELGLTVNAVNVADKAVDEEAYVNLRAEASWAVRKAFKDGDVELPENDENFLELTNIKYKFPGGRIQIEAKEDMKKRGLQSPDTADALMLTYAPSKPKAAIFI